MSSRVLLAVDPSTRNMGWAVVKLDDTSRTGRYVKSGVLRMKKDLDGDVDGEASLEWVARVDEVVKFVMDKATSVGADEVYIEMPSTYGGGKGGVASNSGAVMKLAFCVAAVRGALIAGGFTAVLLPVVKWKGTLPKTVTQLRVKKHWGVIGDHNEIDAVGMLDWVVRVRLGYEAQKKVG